MFLGTKPDLGPDELVATGTDSSFTAADLAPSTTYYWRVDQVADDFRVASPVASFTTASQIAAIRPRLLDPRLESDALQFEVATQSGFHYRIERLTQPAPGNWIPEGAAFPGTGAGVTVSVPTTTGDSGVFRVVVVP